MRPKAILGVTSDLSLRLMRGWPEYLVGKGWDVHLVVAPGPHLDLLRSTNTASYSIHEIQMQREISPGRDALALVAWVSLMKRLKPDLVMLGTPKAALLGLLAAALLRIPVRVYVLRGLRAELERGLRRRLLACMEWITAQQATHIIAVSQSLATLYLQQGLAPRSKVRVLGPGSSNGVDVNRFRPLNPGERHERDRPIIGFVGRLAADKGISTLESALEALSHGGTRFELLLIGGDENGLRSQDRTRVTYPVRATGHIEDTAPYIRQMDLLVLPTLREGFPNVVLEAAASQVPVITTTATGAIDSVIQGQTGLLVTPGDPKALEDAIKLLLQNPDMRQQYGRAGRKHILDNYKQTDVWERHEAFLRECLTARTNP